MQGKLADIYNIFVVQVTHATFEGLKFSAADSVTGHKVLLLDEGQGRYIASSTLHRLVNAGQHSARGKDTCSC